MKIHTLGTSAGTQPIEGFHHTSTAIETQNGLYFFDAGECAAYTAHIHGIDLLRTKAIFLTHPHMDHVGGLGNLLWYIRKVDIVRKNVLTEKDNIDIFTPCPETVDGFMQVLRHTEGDFVCRYRHTVHPVREGVLFDNGELCVTAVHTTHMDNGLSFAFRVECEGKTVVLSGDMRSEDMEHILPAHCDAFLVETGHHQIEEIVEKINRYGKTVEKLLFTHNGGYIMRDIGTARQRVMAAFGERGIICTDGMSFDV